MCPSTPLWQNTLADTVGKLVNTCAFFGTKPVYFLLLHCNTTCRYGVDGVYVDQVASAAAKPCFDPSHDHSIGGGSYWVSGYSKMLQAARQQAGNKAVILTESNAEPFMADINVYLSLEAFADADFIGSHRIVPAFASIYGGYYTAMGAVFYQNDFANPDVFAAKVAKQFMFGAMLGWFSLGGRNNTKFPVALFDILMSPAYISEVLYVKLLSDARAFLVPHLMLGRAMRDLPVVVNGSIHNAGAIVNAASSFPKFGSEDGQLVGTLLHQAWLSRDGRLLIAMTNAQRHGSTHVALDISLLRYGVPGYACVFEVSPFDGSRRIVQRSIAQLVYEQVLAARSLTLLLICPGDCNCD